MAEKGYTSQTLKTQEGQTDYINIRLDLKIIVIQKIKKGIS